MKKTILIIAFIVISSTAFSQTAEVKEGTITVIKPETQLVDTIIIAPFAQHAASVRQLIEIKNKLTSPTLTIKELYSLAGDLAELIPQLSYTGQIVPRPATMIQRADPIKKSTRLKN